VKSLLVRDEWRASMINTNFKGSVPGRCFFIYVRTFNWLPVACMLSSLNHYFVNNVTVIVLQTGDTKQSRLESISVDY
jgi:hypothetical protein